MTLRSRSTDLGTQHILPAVGHTREKLRYVGLVMASVIYDVGTEVEQVEALTTVLECLGYRVKNPAPSADVRTDVYGRIDRYHSAAKIRAKRYERGEATGDLPITMPIRGYSVRRHGLEPVCGVDRGTIKGYNRHITAYNTACNDCMRARQESLDERWTRLGIAAHARGKVSRW